MASNLETLLEKGALKTSDVDPREIRQHLQNAREYLGVADTAAGNDLVQGGLAYDCAFQLALAALKLKGYRPDDKLGHRQIVFQLLDFTCPAMSKQSQISFANAHNLRNRLVYDASGANLTGEALRTFLADTHELLEEVQHLAKAAGVDLTPKRNKPA